MIGYQSTLLGRTEVAEGTMAFQFEKPNDFVFKAGQYIDLTLSDCQPGPSNGLTHTFSIASSPFDEELLVTTRIRNTVFKQAISSLPIGSRARIEGPMGSFCLHNNTARPAVFFAGGIGIAPFISMLTYATEENLRHRIVLFYVNRYRRMWHSLMRSGSWRLQIQGSALFLPSRAWPIITAGRGRLGTSARKCCSPA